MMSLGLATAVIRYVHTIACLTFHRSDSVTQKRKPTRASAVAGFVTSVLIRSYVAPPPEMAEIMGRIVIIDGASMRDRNVVCGAALNSSAAR
jgi:hypothetical protein